MKLTAHAQNDRLDRLVAIIDHVGIGEIAIEAPNLQNPGTIAKVTTTGVILIVDESSDRLVTGYLGTFQQVVKIYRIGGQDHLPQWMVKRLRENKKNYSFLFNL